MTSITFGNINSLLYKRIKALAAPPQFKDTWIRETLRRRNAENKETTQRYEILPIMPSAVLFQHRLRNFSLYIQHRKRMPKDVLYVSHLRANGFFDM